MNDIFQRTNTGGSLYVFEHNPLNPATRHIFNTCPLDKNARMISASSTRSMMDRAGFTNLKIYYTLFFPQILKYLRPLERIMRFIPFGGQYLVYGEKCHE